MAIHVTFGDGFHRASDEPCSSFERALPARSKLRELKLILSSWAGFGADFDCFELAAPFTADWKKSFGQRSRPLPTEDDETSLAELVRLMVEDGGYTGVGENHLAVFAQRPLCPKCKAGGSWGKAAETLGLLGGPSRFEDSGGRVVYQVGHEVRCGNCWLKET